MANGKAKISSKSKSHPEKGKGFGNFIYDSEAGSCFGRTPGSWVKIIIFYIIFYTCLAGFFSLNYYIFSRTLNEDSPRWILGESIIGTNPGVGFRPMPDQDSNAESTLIWYHSSDNNDAKIWYSQLDHIVKESDLPEGAGLKNCNYNGESATPTQACRVDVSNLGPCTADQRFGYMDGKPCVLIKLNKIYGWTPEPFGIKDGKYDKEGLEKELEELVKDDDMPVELKNRILKEVQNSPGNEVNKLNTVWISCAGESVGDKEHLPNSLITYHPKGGIPGFYFPYHNQKMYKSPFVMVHFDLPMSSRHVLINVECRAWARNIKYEKQFRLGSTHFELMVD